MRKDSKKEIAKLTAKRLLLSLAKLAAPFFEASSVYRYGAKKLIDEIGYEQEEIRDKIAYLRDMGYIETFVDRKERYIEITKKGVGRLEKIKESDISIEKPDHWDGKWRVAFFDIAEKHKLDRDRLRRKFLKLGFIKIQKSIYVYPFECTKEIDFILSRISVNGVLILVADAIRNEEILVKHFVDRGILSRSDLKVRK